jgi:GNAT superfamily N-acetyltransferase
MEAITYRRGTVDDCYDAFCVFQECMVDLRRRVGLEVPGDWSDPERLAQRWKQQGSFFEHLARTAGQFWLAEQGTRVIGFGSSVERGEVQQLTTLFVVPALQSSGVGRELLARAFPDTGLRYRSIVATVDVRAQARYLKAGVYPYVPLYGFSRQPEQVIVDSDVTFVSLTDDPERLSELARIDSAILGYRRDEDHKWLMSTRQGHLYLRDGHAVGYGYTGVANGPFALMDASDFPAVLAHAESLSAQAGSESFALQVPMCNRYAVDALLARGFLIHSFISLLMANHPFGRLEQYVVTSPPFFL